MVKKVSYPKACEELGDIQHAFGSSAEKHGHTQEPAIGGGQGEAGWVPTLPASQKEEYVVRKRKGDPGSKLRLGVRHCTQTLLSVKTTPFFPA